jgi:ribonuclease I
MSSIGRPLCGLGPVIVGALLCILGAVAPQAAQAQTLDHYTLIMAWLPGQCLVDPLLPLCEKLTIKDPAGRNLTLIGLRPDPRPGSVPLRDCDPMTQAFSTPLFAGEADSIGAEACRLPVVKLSDALSKSLAALMPTTAQCDERRFWASYGSCSMLSQERYFQRAVDRGQDMQQSVLNVTIAGAIGTRIKRDALVEAFTQQFGEDSAASLQLVCGRAKERPASVLTEIRISLTQQGTMRSLDRTGLWQQNGSLPRHRCPDDILIPEAGQPIPDAIAAPAAPGTVNVPQMPTVPAPAAPTIAAPTITVPTITAPTIAKPDPTKPQPMDTEPMEIIPPTP